MKEEEVRSGQKYIIESLAVHLGGQWLVSCLNKAQQEVCCHAGVLLNNKQVLPVILLQDAPVLRQNARSQLHALKYDDIPGPHNHLLVMMMMMTASLQGIMQFNFNVWH